ncbi:DUF523 domain-containing protein [Abyssisolibacter fermentans]|uniref:DUF523 domain-containing protein n=1 Tax=Abyssisolibacter fermentans TaxID=1766203 RepID=UPI0008356239|nr:DUF523 domain-containing protein [Abyssisolibacter fermentans]
MILVSACLAGINCRYNGESVVIEDIVNLIKEGKAVPVCPEQLGGLTTPRNPSEIIKENNEIKVKDCKGNDVTKQFEIGAKETLKFAKSIGADIAILKQRSPSCGYGLVYDGNFNGATVTGNGLTAHLLSDNNIKIYNEENYMEIYNE